MLKNKIFLFLIFLAFGWSFSQRFLPQTASNCPDGYYYNATNSTCDQCNKTLKYCFDCESASICLQCLSGSVLTNGK